MKRKARVSSNHGSNGRELQLEWIYYLNNNLGRKEELQVIFKQIAFVPATKIAKDTYIINLGLNYNNVFKNWKIFTEKGLTLKICCYIITNVNMERKNFNGKI